MHWLRGSIQGYSADIAGFQGEHGTIHSLPLMSKGEEKDKRKSIAEEESIAINDKGGDCWNCFYRQHRLVIDGKYSSDNGLSTTVKMEGSER